MKQAAYLVKRQQIAGQPIVSIDPGKRKHTASVQDAAGVQVGSTFSFKVTWHGFHRTFWNEISQRLENTDPEELVIVIETSCNLWQTIAQHCYARGFKVLLVSPFTTHHLRPALNLDFTKTDPKDAFVIGDAARNGFYTLYECFETNIEALHELSITFCTCSKV